MLLYNGYIGDRGVMAIANALMKENYAERPVLQTLGIGSNEVGERGAAALGRALNTKHVALTCLFLESNTKIGDNGAFLIAEGPT